MVLEKCIVIILFFSSSIFVHDLENSAQNLTKMGDIFVNNERKLLQYVVFCQNKPICDFIMNEYINDYFEVGK